jgi:hypothetical protein
MEAGQRAFSSFSAITRNSNVAAGFQQDLAFERPTYGANGMVQIRPQEESFV